MLQVSKNGKRPKMLEMPKMVFEDGQYTKTFRLVATAREQKRGIPQTR